MLPWLRFSHANPHADHWHGRRAADAVEAARAVIAELVGGYVEGVIFTSGATEANNMALKGVLNRDGKVKHIWMSDIEHKSMMEPARYMAGEGKVALHHLAVSLMGEVDLTSSSNGSFRAGRERGLLAVAHGNNEIGTVQDLKALSRIAHSHDHIMHVDASQTAGHLPIHVLDEGVDLLCLSSHKMYGPAGIGALYIDPDLMPGFVPQMHGGGQERGLRSGTVAPFLAVGFGAAASLALSQRSDRFARLTAVASVFLNALRTARVSFAMVGHPTKRIPGHLALQIFGVPADDLLNLVTPRLSISAGSACASGELRSSSVLRAIGMDEDKAGEVIRISFGVGSSEDDAVAAAAIVVEAISRVLARDL
jgi:cysteine desulfurase